MCVCQVLSYFVRDGHSNLIPADDLEYAVYRFVLIHAKLVWSKVLHLSQKATVACLLWHTLSERGMRAESLTPFCYNIAASFLTVVAEM